MVEESSHRVYLRSTSPVGGAKETNLVPSAGDEIGMESMREDTGICADHDESSRVHPRRREGILASPREPISHINDVPSLSPRDGLEPDHVVNVCTKYETSSERLLGALQGMDELVRKNHGVDNEDAILHLLDFARTCALELIDSHSHVDVSSNSAASCGVPSLDLGGCDDIDDDSSQSEKRDGMSAGLPEATHATVDTSVDSNVGSGSVVAVDDCDVFDVNAPAVYNRAEHAVRGVICDDSDDDDAGDRTRSDEPTMMYGRKPHASSRVGSSGVSPPVMDAWGWRARCLSQDRVIAHLQAIINAQRDMIKDGAEAKALERREEGVSLASSLPLESLDFRLNVSWPPPKVSCDEDDDGSSDEDSAGIEGGRGDFEGGDDRSF